MPVREEGKRWKSPTREEKIRAISELEKAEKILSDISELPFTYKNTYSYMLNVLRMEKDRIFGLIPRQP